MQSIFLAFYLLAFQSFYLSIFLASSGSFTVKNDNIHSFFFAVLVANYEFAGFAPKQKYTAWTVSTEYFRVFLVSSIQVYRVTGKLSISLSISFHVFFYVSAILPGWLGGFITPLQEIYSPAFSSRGLSWPGSLYSYKWFLSRLT